MAGNTINQTGLVWPARRRFLKNSSAVIGCLASLSIPAVANAFVGGSGAAPSQLAVPAAAALYGFNNRVFFDDFDSISTVDVNNTLAPGYKWYLHGIAPYITTADKISVSNSILTISGSSTQGWSAINMVGFSGSSYPYTPVGTTFPAGGFYVEIKIAADAPGANPGWPGAVIWDARLINSQNGGTYPANGLAEIDIFENIGTGTPQLETVDWTWYSNATQYRQTNYTPNVGTGALNDGLFHTIGVLNVPQSKNGGTGLINRYFDGVHQTNTDVTYFTNSTSPQQNGTPQVGWMSCLDDTTGLFVALETGNNWPLHIDSVQVWQTPS